MSKSLVIAEKPSVMGDLCRALTKRGEKFSKSKDYSESDNYIVTSAVGHLVEQGKPMTAEGKSLPWSWDHLPVIPEKFELSPIEGNKGRLNALVRLMKKREVDLIINACDAGREGELIFRYIVQYSGVEKPMKRLWMQSMTDGAILEAFDDLRTDEQMRPLANAAVCRSEADWLIGINSTRALTAFNSKYGGFNKTPVGRVQTPTLALMVEREIQIREFVPRTYWEVHGNFGAAAGEYAGLWFDPNWKRDPEDKHLIANRIWDKAQAESVVARCQGKPGRVEEKKKPSKQHPAALFDLTSLQRDANGRFGFSARRTLQLAQRLYETHKVATYPRTDSKHLPEDYVDGLRDTFKTFARTPGIGGNLDPMAAKLLENDWLVKSRKVFDNSKITDHHAIIPNGQIPKKLDETEAKLYRLILQRTLAVFFPPAEFEETERVTHVGEDSFRTKGKILVEPGFLEVYGRTGPTSEGGDEKDKTLVPVGEGESVKTESVESIEKATKPPARYNEATLLRAMETAGKRVDDEGLSEAMAERGLGTPATRANIIEGLIKDQYITRDQRDFIANNRAIRLIEQLDDMGVEILSSPEMTGAWEHKLKQMEENQFERVVFMDEIRKLTKEVVTTAKHHADEELSREYPTFDSACPVCGASPMGQDEGRYKCTAEDCKFTFPKVLSSRPFTDAEVREILSTGALEKKDGFLSRFRKPFEASLVLIEDKARGKKIDFVFEKSEAELAEAEAAKDPSATLCKCPCCDKGEIRTTPTAYICTTRAEGGKCKGRLSREMCKYVIPEEQARKFFEDGETDEITEWISKKGNPFTAKLGCNAKGARLLRWIFPPRKKAAKKATAKKTTKKAATRKATAKKAVASEDKGN